MALEIVKADFKRKKIPFYQTANFLASSAKSASKSAQLSGQKLSPFMNSSKYTGDETPTQDGCNSIPNTSRPKKSRKRVFGQSPQYSKNKKEGASTLMNSEVHIEIVNPTPQATLSPHSSVSKPQDISMFRTVTDSISQHSTPDQEPRSHNH